MISPIKWAGSKNAKMLLHPLWQAALGKFRKTEYVFYYEGMFGSGRMLAAISSRVNMPNMIASDSNEWLIGTHKAIADAPKTIAWLLKQMPQTERGYYEIRLANYSDPLRRAAKLIYLMAKCHHGVYRVNSQGQFNSPYGWYNRSLIPSPAHLSAWSNLISKVDLHAGDYGDIVLPTKRGLVYFDPPYDGSDLSYGKHGFDQARLASNAFTCRQNGHDIIISNYDTDYLRDLYGDSWYFYEVAKLETMGRGNATKTAKTEVLISNVDIGAAAIAPIQMSLLSV